MQILEAPPTMAPTVGQQIFTIGSALAGGLAGMIVAKSFAGVEKVPTSYVALATIVSVFVTFGAGLYLARKVKEV